MNLENIDPDIELREKLKKLLSKEGVNKLINLANMLEITPKKVEELIVDLKDEGFNIVDIDREGDKSLDLIKTPQPPRVVIEDYFKNTNTIRVGLIADTHLVSKKADVENLKKAYELFERYEVPVVYHGGNMLDGEKTYPGQEYELEFVGYEQQIDYVVETYPKIEGITTKFIGSSSCHEGIYYKKFGIEVGNRLQKERGDFEYKGLDEVDFMFGDKQNPISLKFMHPGGGTSYALSYKPQKHVESMSGGEKPHILCLAHYHKWGFFTIRNVHVIMVPSLQYQTRFMRKRHIQSIRGCIILDFRIVKGSVIDLVPRYFPFY